MESCKFFWKEKMDVKSLNTEFLINQKLINIFTKKTLHLHFICKSNLCSSSQTFLKAFTFDHICSSFDSG